MWAVLQVFVQLATISLLLSMFWFLAGRHVRAQLSLGGEVLSPGLPGQSLPNSPLLHLLGEKPMLC